METSIKEKIITKSELTNKICSGLASPISGVAIHKRINKMLKERKLARIGRGRYIEIKKHYFSYTLQRDVANDVLKVLQSHLHFTAKYVIYETSLLNLFLNHLIARSTIIVEVEKDLTHSVFWLLKDNGFSCVLLNPNSDENYFYNSYDGSGIIVKTMVSKAPIDNKNHRITIEKLMVDMVCDKTTNMFYEGAEIPNMLEDIVDSYAIKFDSVRNYAKRRHCLDRFIDHLPDEMKGLFNDQARNVHQNQY